MRIEAAFLADFVSAREGLLSALGAGIDQVRAAEYPINLPISIGALFFISAADLGDQDVVDVPIRVRVRDGERRLVAEITFSLKGAVKDPTKHARLPIAIDLRPVVISKPGPYLVDLTIRGRRAQLGFEAVVVPVG